MANPWDNDAVVTPSKGGNPWDADEVVKPTAKPVVKPQAAPKSMLGQYADIHPGVGAAETIANLATGSVAAPLSGLAGLGAAAGKALGLTDKDPADVVRGVGSALTYQPRTTAGKGAVGAITAPFEALAKGADIAGKYTAEKTGSPFLGAAVNTAIQGLPAIAGKVLKKPMAARLANETEALEAAKKANLPRDTAVQEARDLGYSLPPNVANVKGPLSSFFSGVAGGTALDYGASFKNQRVTNGLIKKELGLAADEPISVKALDELREKHGQVYEGVKKTVPELQVTPEFKAMLNDPNGKFAAARKDFPGQFKNREIQQLVKDLSQDKFSSAGAIDLQKKLRADGRANMKAYDKPAQKALGEAQLNAADAIDGLIDQNLAMKAPPGVNNFQSKLSANLAEARKRIAQTYAVENALNDATGNVSARTLAKAWDKEQKLTGGLKDVAKTAKAFEKQLRDVDKLPGTAKESISNLDVAKATGLAALGHGALGALATVGRAGVKPLLLSDYYQNRYIQPPAYTPGLGYTLPSQVLNNPLFPIATIPRPPQEQR